MNESSNISYLLRQKVQLEFPTTTIRNVLVDFPVSCDGKEEIHTWELSWESTRQDWNSGQYSNPMKYLYCYSFNLSGKQINAMKYGKGFYEIKITNNLHDQDVVLAEETADLNGPDYNEFKFKTKVPFSKFSLMNATVIVTLQSYVIESPPHSTFKRMLDCGSHNDVVIKTKSRDFPCHKVVLAFASDYFRKMFEVDMKEKNESVVNWVDIFEADSVQDLLHYIYTGQSPPNIANTYLTLIEIAHMCLMDNLMLVCARQLQKSMNVENMGDILRVATKNESKELQEIAVNFIVKNYDLNKEAPAPWDHLESKFWKSLGITILKTMVVKKIFL